MKPRRSTRRKFKEPKEAVSVQTINQATALEIAAWMDSLADDPSTIEVGVNVPDSLPKRGKK